MSGAGGLLVRGSGGGGCRSRGISINAAAALGPCVGHYFLILSAFIAFLNYHWGLCSLQITNWP